jgi:hypothetical protein
MIKVIIIKVLVTKFQALTSVKDTALYHSRNGVLIKREVLPYRKKRVGE